MPLRWLALCVVALAVAPGRAQACGVSATGVASCSLADRAEQTRPRWVMGVNALYTSTRLRFGGGVYAEQQRSAILALLAYVPTPSLVLQAGVGAALGGSLRLADGEYEISPGPIGSLGADWRVWAAGRWFVSLTSVLSVSAAKTETSGGPSAGYQALDLRLGAAIGADVAEALQPYALARVFGGPVFWRHAGGAVSGTDTHHYQLGAGLAVRPAQQLNLFVEGVPLGERAFSGGVGLVF